MASAELLLLVKFSYILCPLSMQTISLNARSLGVKPLCTTQWWQNLAAADSDRSESSDEAPGLSGQRRVAQVVDVAVRFFPADLVRNDR